MQNNMSVSAYYVFSKSHIITVKGLESTKIKAKALIFKDLKYKTSKNEGSVHKLARLEVINKMCIRITQ